MWLQIYQLIITNNHVDFFAKFSALSFAAWSAVGPLAGPHDRFPPAPPSRPALAAAFAEAAPAAHSSPWIRSMFGDSSILSHFPVLYIIVSEIAKNLICFQRHQM